MTERLARALIVAHETRVATMPSDDTPQTADEAYDVQRRVIRYFGPPGGFKTGQQGSAPRIVAPIRGDRVYESGAEIRADGALGIELEIGFRILEMAGRDLVRRAEPVVALELVQSRIAGPRAAEALVKLADLQINWGLVVGETAPDWGGGDDSTVRGRLVMGSRVVLDGAAAVQGGSALRSLSAAAKLAAREHDGLVPGQVVITGSLNPLVWAEPGTRIEGWIEGIGTVAAQLRETRVLGRGEG
ncbi:hydratase [Litorisediminicola beolgyonensis]|uniref:Hydratase n=1 Tax=Litorisediminicola beolgyonensis TaxID=1173614 RepID=A0ABW3ZM32_9RHOB